MPARAPWAPACQEPSRLFTWPRRSSSLVASPRYQTLPCLSCAYQSSVSSATPPPLKNTRSWTTTALMPRMVFVLWVTVMTSVCRSPSFSPLYRSVVPGRSGNHGLSTRLTKFEGLGAAGGAAADVATDVTSAATAAVIEAVCLRFMATGWQANPERRLSAADRG